MRAEEGEAWLFLVIMCRSGKCTGLVMPLLERVRPRQLLMISGKFLVELSRNVADRLLFYIDRYQLVYAESRCLVLEIVRWVMRKASRSVRNVRHRGVGEE